jgi:hypothetical protein
MIARVTTAAVLLFVAASILHGLEAAQAAREVQMHRDELIRLHRDPDCMTDSECMELCPPEDTQCDGGPEPAPTVRRVQV